MMDLKEIIKWFLPCSRVILRMCAKRMDVRLTVVCLFLIFSCPSYAAKVYSHSDVDLSLSDASFLKYNDNDNVTKNFDFNDNERDRSGILENNSAVDSRQLYDSSVGRTFGRPFKKMLQAMIPLAFQLGTAATWAVVAALVGIKTLGVTLIILKLLLVAGAAKIGALFASKGHHHSQEWAPVHTPLQKEIHLHIHNGNHGEEHVPISPWSREGVQNPAETKHVNVVFDPYAAGPQTISTPYGHYMKIEPGGQVTQ